MTSLIKRILVYTPNSIGLGHLFRTLAVITGIRKQRPDIDFLVLTGSSLPNVLLESNIEVIKLPGIEQDINGDRPKFRPRRMNSLEIGDLISIRKKIIEDVFYWFKPDAVIMEHKIAGLLNEAEPLLQAKAEAAGKKEDFALVHISRGILGTNGVQQVAGFDRSLKIPDLYDLIYVLEDESKADEWRAIRKSSGRAGSNIHFFGGITIKTRSELPPRDEVLRRLGLPDRPIILASLGRHGNVTELFARAAAACEEQGFRKHQLVVIKDPYLQENEKAKLNASAVKLKAIILPFVFELIDLINISDLTISRCGCNTVNEIQLTGARAVVIPERHPSGEQEQRAGRLPPTIMVMNESQVLDGELALVMPQLLKQPAPAGRDYDKYKIGRRIIRDLENWAVRRRQ